MREAQEQAAQKKKEDAEKKRKAEIKRKEDIKNGIEEKEMMKAMDPELNLILHSDSKTEDLLGNLLKGV